MSEQISDVLVCFFLSKKDQVDPKLANDYKCRRA